MMNQNLCQPEKLDYVTLELLVEDAERCRLRWLEARQRAIDAWIKFMMPKLYREQHELTEQLARQFAEMCLIQRDCAFPDRRFILERG